jgi:hypothetical protein
VAPVAPSTLRKSFEESEGDRGDRYAEDVFRVVDATPLINEIYQKTHEDDPAHVAAIAVNARCETGKNRGSSLRS